MSLLFLHTADWQLGKPFARVEDAQKRALLQQERLAVLGRLGEVARARGAQFILVAGDLFDSPSATKATVSAACSVIGAMGVPVLAIPGNHDHGGPGSLWEQPFFNAERAALAPNFRMLLRAQPVELENAVLLPCPLLRRHESKDPTTWLRSMEGGLERFGEKPRLVLAHGSVQGFSSPGDDDEATAANLIDLGRLPEIDYVALGDWHGTKQVGPRAWYAGTPEIDRFPRGETNDPGHVLLVEARRGALPVVEKIRTARLGWHQLEADFSEDAALGRLEAAIEALIGSRAQQDLLRLELRGSLGIEATTRLEEKLEAWQARLLRLKLYNRTVVAPLAEEIEALANRLGDPLIARVAQTLVARAGNPSEAPEARAAAAVARIALRELHAACAQP
jgi:DNA repair exonuclease SbcCD nuclease subunit